MCIVLINNYSNINALFVWKKPYRLVSRKGHGFPNHSQRASLLKKILTVPSLLDVCSLYGCIENDVKGSAASICQSMLALRPHLEMELAVAGADIAENMENVCRACIHALSGVGQELQTALQSVKEGVEYLYDSCLTLCALLKSLPLAAASLLQKDTSLIAALGVLHDQLVPEVALKISSIGSSINDQGLAGRCLQLEVASEVAANILLVNGMLRPTDAGSSSSSTFVSHTAARALGEALIEVLSMLGIRESSEMGGDPSLVPALAQRHGLSEKIQTAVADGIVSLDDAQSDYIAALMQVPSLSSFEQAPTGMNNGHNEDGVMVALVNQLHDIVPHFGKGYVALCLDAFDGNLDRALNALLEGSQQQLPGEVATGADQNLTWEEYLNRKNKKFGTQDQGLSGAKTNHKQTHSLTAKYLDTKDVSYHNIAKAEALDAQWEYDDEYDDSFDDLLHVGADGLAEAEGEVSDALAARQGMETVASVIKDLDLGEPSAAMHAESSGSVSNQLRGKRFDRKKKLWVYQGRIYNYAKPGAQEVGSEAEAQEVLRQAEAAAQEIHGLGPGGNKQRAVSSDDAVTDESTQGRKITGSYQRTNSKGTQRTGQHGWKDRQKAAVGNHHRKDRAAQKASKGMI